MAQAAADKLVASTATAAFASTLDGRIVAWNAAAGRLLGHDSESAIGRSCSKLLGGIDVFGNRFCGPNCPVRSMARRGEAVHEFEMTVRDASLHAIRVLLASLVLPGRTGESPCVVHLLRPIREGQTRGAVYQPRESPLEAACGPPASSADARLTSRELDVLRLLRQGIATEEVASVLGISAKTVRNHIQNSFGKLGAHNRLEALSVARRRRLL